MSRFTVKAMHGHKAMVIGEAKPGFLKSLFNIRPTEASAFKVKDLQPLPPLQTTDFGADFRRSALRSQSIRYELLANSGRYCSLNRVATGTQPFEVAKPMQWLVLSPNDAEFFAPDGDRSGKTIFDSLRCELADNQTGKTSEKILVPVHWQEAEVLKAQLPELVILTDGEVFSGASPRSLFFGPTESSEPQLASATKNFCIKTHLSAQAYSKLGGLTGSRELNRNDCLMASVISHVLQSVKPNISPLVDFQSESRTVVAKLKPATDSSKSLEVGAIFRELTSEPLVPGFALFSETTERLPHVPATESVIEVSAGRAYVEKPRILAREAIDFAHKNNPELSRDEIFLRLFVDPLLDTFFSMAREGISMELHSQNFLLGFDSKTGFVDRLVIRDLHGINYSHAYREKSGKPDLFSVEALKPHFPNIRQEDIDDYFMRNGAIRDRYLEPNLWKGTLDFFMSSFWFQTLAATSPEPFSEKAREQLMNRIRDRVSEKASTYQFDLSQLPQPSSSVQFHTLAKNGIRGRIIFRHPVKQGVDHVS